MAHRRSRCGAPLRRAYIKWGNRGNVSGLFDMTSRRSRDLEGVPRLHKRRGGAGESGKFLCLQVCRQYVYDIQRVYIQRVDINCSCYLALDLTVDYGMRPGGALAL